MPAETPASTAPRANVQAPDRQQVRRRAAADPEDVLRGHERLQVLDRALEERQLGRLALMRAHRAVERQRAAVVVAARGSQVTDLRTLLRGEPEDERVQSRVRIIGQEGAPADRHDMAVHKRTG
jgi:hypothetical protein